MSHSYKLFVDDMRAIPEGWIGARSVSEAIAIIATLPISHVSLDHDILLRAGVGGLYQALSHETFKGVAYYIALHGEIPKENIRIHTANAGAAYTLCEILGVPFEEAYRIYTADSYEA